MSGWVKSIILRRESQICKRDTMFCLIFSFNFVFQGSRVIIEFLKHFCQKVMDVLISYHVVFLLRKQASGLQVQLDFCPKILQNFRPIAFS